MIGKVKEFLAFLGEGVTINAFDGTGIHRLMAIKTVYMIGSGQADNIDVIPV